MMGDHADMKPAGPFFLRLCAAFSLLAGLALGVWLYVSAPERDDAGAGFVIEGGQVRAVRAEDSRAYRRGLEYMGGKSAVLAEELRGQAADLWRGGGASLLAGALGLGVCALLWRAADRIADKAMARPGGRLGGDPSRR